MIVIDHLTSINVIHEASTSIMNVSLSISKSMPLPTLLLKDMFVWPEGTELTRDEERMTNEWKAIDIYLHILNQKLQSTGILNRISILRAFTGAGKSTVFPPNLYKQLLVKNNRGLLMSEPRKNLTNNGVNDILNYETKWTLGKELAIHTGDIKVQSTDKAFIEFCTTQVIQNFLTSILDTHAKGDSRRVKSLLERYLVITVDEAHILELPNLSVIASIKQVLNLFGNQPNCPMFVFASATLSEKQILEYFDAEGVSLKYILSTIKGVPNNPIEDHSLSASTLQQLSQENKDIYVTIAKHFAKSLFKPLFDSKSFVHIDEFNRDYQCRDALIFVPGLMQIETVTRTLSKEINDQPLFLLTRESTLKDLESWREEHKGKRRTLVMGYSAEYSALSLMLLEAPYEVDADVLEFETKVIVTTSVIETGKTIQLLKLCIDAGFDKKVMYTPLIYDYRQNYLTTVPANQSQITQRKGRVGRKSPGVFIKFYTEECYANRLKNDLPETVNNGCLSELIYTTQINKLPKSCCIDVASMNDYMYPISPDLLLRTADDLFFANVIGSNGEYINEEREEKWITYARLAYVLLKMSLFRAIMTAVINSYNLPPVYQIYGFNATTFNLSIEKAISIYYKKAADFIPQGRLLFKQIVEGKSRAIVPYRGDIYDIDAND